MEQSAPSAFRIVIAGDSFAGLTQAIALNCAFNGDVPIAVVGPGGGAQLALESPRAFAISAAAKALYEILGVWPEIAAEAQPVLTIELTDSPLTAGVRPVLLTYDNRLETGEPASYIVPASVLGRALVARLKEARGVQILAGCSVETYSSTTGTARATLSDGRAIMAELLICAEGRNRTLRKAAGLDDIGWSHDQTGIVVTVAHEKPHDGKAVQHFLPAGPFAMLPLKGNKCCITWSEKRQEAERILALSDDDFLEEVEQRFGGKLGAISLVSERGRFPLSTHIARQYAGERLVLIGDAAHGVHPIAGQGLNLALRDVAALTECLVDGARVGLDLGDYTLLERYERWRRFDSTVSAGAFATINRMFSNDWPLLRSAREIGLGTIDRLPGIKAMLVAEAAGKSGELPKLLKGETCSV